MSRRWVLLLVIAPILAIAIGTTLILRFVSTPETPSAEMPPTSVSQTVVASRPAPDRPVAINAPLPTTVPTPDPVAIELATLRAQIETLRKENADLRASVQNLQSGQTGLTEKRAPATPAAQPQPTAEDFSAFAKRFVPLQQEAQQEISTPFADMKFKIGCKLIGSDLKKTDSLTNPVVGVVVIDTTTTSLANDDSVISIRDDIDTIIFAPVEGKWKPISFVRKLNSAVPSTSDAPGTETVIAPDMATSAAEAAQR